MDKKKIILASKSPRRKILLERLNLCFDIIPSQYNEPIKKLDKFSYTKIENLAKNKALSIGPLIKNKNTLIISADTVVILNNKIFIKPINFMDAYLILKNLSAKTHKVVTSVCLYDYFTKKIITFSDTTYVTFNYFTDNTIKKYILKKRPYDKAGAYGIQELDKSLIKKINGSFDNIIGLPSEKLKTTLYKNFNL